MIYRDIKILFIGFAAYISPADARNGNVLSVILNEAARSEESGCGRQSHPTVTPREGIARPRESRRRECVCLSEERFSRRVHGTLLRMTQWAYRPRTYSPTGFFAALHSAQNDRVEIVSQAPCAPFSSKCRRCNSPTERDDGLYWRTAHCRATRRGSRCGIFTKNLPSTTTPFFVKMP